jgi:hypothetical protein
LTGLFGFLRLITIAGETGIRNTLIRARQRMTDDIAVLKRADREAAGHRSLGQPDGRDY